MYIAVFVVQIAHNEVREEDAVKLVLVSCTVVGFAGSCGSVGDCAVVSDMALFAEPYVA